MQLQTIKDLPKTVEFLTTSERTRLDDAVTLYNDTMTMNAQHKYDHQTPRERKRYALGYVYQPSIKTYRELIEAYKADPVGKWWKQADQVANMKCGGVYKSALLHRILEGKKPLPFPPPCSYSYPWYEIVEETGPHVISDLALNGVRSLGSLMTGLGGAKATTPKALKDRGITSLTIHQTSYVIADANQAGIELLLTIADMYTSPDAKANDDSIVNGSNEEYPIVTANHPLIGKVMDAYSRGPEFKVKHGAWEQWRLFVGQREASRIDSEFGQKLLAEKPFGKFNRNSGINPLNLIFEGLNAKLLPNFIEKEDTFTEGIDAELKNITEALNGRNPHAKPDLPIEWNPGGLASMLENAEGKAHKPREYIFLQWDVWKIEKA